MTRLASSTAAPLGEATSTAPYSGTLAPLAAGRSKRQMTKQLSISAVINGKSITRFEVQQWEARRATVVLKKLASRLGSRAIAEIAPDLNIDAVITADLDRQRAALVVLKTGLGHAGMCAMLRRELAISERLARFAVAASRGRTAHSVSRLVALECSAAVFAEWFNGLTASNAEVDMINACPDHYLLRGLPDGRQEVIETTGGSPTPTRFLVDYTKTQALSIPVHPDYPVQIAGQAELDDGFTIGGVRHQFRDHGGAMEALLTVEFPRMFPPAFIAAHRWHLATEFSNWIIASRRE
jgi:hypothetical protein